MVVSLKKQEAPQEPPRPQAPLPPRKKRRLGRWLALLLLAALLFAGGYYLSKRAATESAPENSGRSSISVTPEASEVSTEAEDTVARVGKLIVLPEGEDPTVATVTDPEKLRDQSFFANAKKGDKVLIYTRAKKAYLYDPSLNKLIEVAPITTQP